MIRVLILDDEPLAVRQMEMYVARVPFLEAAGSCTAAAQARGIIEAGGVDVLFADINMPDVSGLDFVRSLEHPPVVVFTTAYSEYALEGFRVNAVDYLLKPFSFEEFERSALKVREIVEGRRSAAGHMREREVLQFRSGYRTVMVDPERIIYVESMNEYLKIHLDGERSPLVVLYRLKNMADMLPADRFMRIHRSYVISVDRIKETGRNCVVMRGGTVSTPSGDVLLPDVTLPVGESYRRDFNARFAAAGGKR